MVALKKINIIVIALLMSVATSLSLSAPGYAEETAWTDPIVLSTDELGLSLDPQLAASSDGERLHAVWQENSLLTYRGSADSGASWSEAQTLSDTVLFSNFYDIDTSSDGQEVTVVWRELDQFNRKVIKLITSQDGGVTWSDPVVVSHPVSGGDEPMVYVSDDGLEQYVIWTGSHVEGIYSTDAGLSWSNRQFLSDVSVNGTSETRRNARLIGSENGFLVAWSNLSNDLSRGVVYSTGQFSDGVVEWTAERALPEASILDDRDNDSFFIDSSDDLSTIAMAWNGPDGTAVSVSADNGDSWSTPSEYNPDSDVATDVSVSVNDNGSLVVLAWVNPISPVYIVTSVDSGATWSSQEEVSVASEAHEAITVEVQEDRLLLFWRDRTDGGASLTQSSSIDLGSSWSTPFVLSDSKVQNNMTEIITANDGRFVGAAWANSGPLRTIEFSALSLEQSLMCNGMTPTIVGTEGDDELIGTPDADVIMGLGGNDVIQGLAGDDVICGGDGNDEIRGNRGNDIIFGDAGDDVIRGNRDNDTIYGGNGNDELRGGREDDTIYGEAGEDTLYGRRGNDTLYGGLDNDILRGNTGEDVLDGGDGTDELRGGQDTDSCLNGETNINCEV